MIEDEKERGRESARRNKTEKHVYEAKERDKEMIKMKKP